MTEEHKEKIRIGKQNAKLGIKKPVVEKVRMPMSEEHKAKIKAGHAKAKLEGRVRKPRVTREKQSTSKFSSDKITVHVTGKETNSYDFFKPIRSAYRDRKNYKDISKILNEISNSVWNTDVHKIIELLRYHCDVVIDKQQ